MTNEYWWSKQYRISSVPAHVLREHPMFRERDAPLAGDAEAVVREDSQSVCLSLAFPNFFPIPSESSYTAYLTDSSGQLVRARAEYSNDDGVFERNSAAEDGAPNFFLPLGGLLHRSAGSYRLHVGLWDERHAEPRPLIQYAFDLRLPGPVPFDRVALLSPLYLLGSFVDGTPGRMPKRIRDWLSSTMGFSTAEVAAADGSVPLVMPKDIGSVIDALRMRAPGLSGATLLQLLADVARVSTSAGTQDRVKRVFIEGLEPETGADIWPEIRRRIGLG